jgi:hypothetical protein
MARDNWKEHSMHKPRVRRPSAAMIVAVIALVFAVTGTAMAVSGLNHKQKKQVKKIITKKVPGLTVASAATAGKANNIYSAQVAANGTMLGSVPTGATSKRLTNGIYDVTMTHPYAGCLISSNLANLGTVVSGETDVGGEPANPKQLGVGTYNSAGVQTDHTFYVQMICP